MHIPGYDAWRLRGPDDYRCPECNGYERLECETCDGHGHVLDGIDCAICEGTGFVQCLACRVEEPDGDYEYERRRDEVEARGKVKECGE